MVFVVGGLGMLLVWGCVFQRQLVRMKIVLIVDAERFEVVIFIISLRYFLYYLILGVILQKGNSFNSNFIEVIFF